MKELNLYDINLFSLSNKVHEFSYTIEDSFFKLFENSPVESGKLKVEVSLDKSDTMLQTIFNINGVVTLICDRSLEPFNETIDTAYKIIFKYADDFAELSEDLYHIPQNLQQLNIAQYIYELICIEIPMKKLHPDLRPEDEFDDEEDELSLVYSDVDPEETEDEKDSDNNENIDPRWKDLLDLKSNKK